MEERGDIDKVSQVMFLMLCHVTCVVKQAVFFMKEDKIDELIAMLDEPLLNAESGADGAAGALLSSAARSARRLLRVYAGCAFATCVLWIVFPILYRIQGQDFEFHFWIGFKYDETFIFSGVLAYSFYATNLVAVGNTTMDAFIATILDICRVQLRILRENFMILPERVTTRAIKPAERKEGAECTERTKRSEDAEGRVELALNKLLIECLAHYKKVIDLASISSTIIAKYDHENI